MAEMTLSQSTGATLRSHQSAADLLTRSRERLTERTTADRSTQAQSAGVTATDLVNRAGELSQLSEAVSEAAETVKAAGDGIDRIIDLLEAARQAIESGVSADDASLTDQLKELLAQIDATTSASGVNGINLLKGDSLSVSFNADGTGRLDIDGVDDTAAGLGLEALSPDVLASDEAIGGLLENLAAALDTLKTQAGSFDVALSKVETSQDFTQGMIAMLQAGASSLAIADTDEEAAGLLALQLRQQLSSTSQSLTAEADQSVLRLI